MINEWGPWGPCRSCDRPHGEKQKNAYCRIKPAPPVEDEEFSKEDELNNIEEVFKKLDLRFFFIKLLIEN